MKKLLLVLSLVLFVMGTALAQRTITGTVTDESGETLIGASILVKGTTTGAVTDIDGTYSITVPDGSRVLQFSYTGYATQEVELNTSNVVDVVMQSSAEVFDEMVVTGLGIERDKKALGYGVTTLTADESLVGRQETDVARLLRGKATGVDITQTSGMVGSGTNVIIRGYSSITGTNQPLFVVDGAPLNTSTNNDANFAQGGAMASSRFLDLDPNNIKEISILKGLSATVLYGEAGRNGVILVTTKTGSAADADKGLEVSITQNISVTEVANLPDYQNTFGNGFSGNFGWFFSNWGPSFDTRGSNGIGADGTIVHPYDQAQYNDDFPEFIGADYQYRPYESVENFFQRGLTSNTSVSISNRVGDNTSVTATYSYLDDEGFLPKLDEQRGGGASNFLRKHNFSLGAQTRLSNGLGVKGSFNYVNSNRRIPPTAPSFGGTSGRPSLFDAIMYTPRSIDLNNLPYQSPIDGSNVYYRRGGAIQNPYWTLNNVSDNETIQRFFSTIEVDYELAPWLKALYRISLDQFTQVQKFQNNRGGANDPLGNMRTSNRLSRLTDQVANLLYNFQLSESITLDGVVGTNFRKEATRSDFLNSSNQFVYGLFTHGNFIEHSNTSFDADENTIGVYGTATLGYKNYLYLNVQARNDWTSTLEPENRAQFYPSASVSFVPTDAFPSLTTSGAVNYLKMRVGYGTSAGYPNPYRTQNYLVANTRQFITAGGSVLNTNAISNRLGNPNLTPELHKELEFGMEARFLNNRFGVDLSLYNKNSENLIIDLNLDPSTGATVTTVNAADLNNRGIELALNFVPVRTSSVNWDFTLNYTRNRSEVQSIFPGVDQVVISGYTNLGNFAVVGEQYGIMQGSPYVRDDNGNLLVNALGSYISGSNIDVIGDPNPDFQANWINNVSWKNFSFGFQWQYQHGGDIYSSTITSLMARGNTVDTDVDRFQPIILPGVKNDGTPNDIQTYIGDSFFDAYFGANEGGVFDGTFIRLRELSLSYVLPKKILDKTPFGRFGITLSGENLWYNAPNTPQGINYDPEVLSLGVGNGRGFDFRTGPTGRRYGLSLNASF